MITDAAPAGGGRRPRRGASGRRRAGRARGPGRTIRPRSWRSICSARRRRASIASTRRRPRCGERSSARPGSRRRRSSLAALLSRRGRWRRGAGRARPRAGPGAGKHPLPHPEGRDPDRGGRLRDGRRGHRRPARGLPRPAARLAAATATAFAPSAARPRPSRPTAGASRSIPGCSEAWWALANLKTYRFTAEERAAVETRASPAGPDAGERATCSSRSPRRTRTPAGTRRPSPATGSQRARAAAPRLRPGPHHRLRPALEGGVHPGLLRQRAGWGLDAPDPIFIVGLPRSGSTLVDQILASHPMVEGTRELQEIQTIADWIAGPPAPGRAARPTLTSSPRCRARRPPSSAPTTSPGPAPCAGSDGPASSTRRRGISCTWA